MGMQASQSERGGLPRGLSEALQRAEHDARSKAAGFRWDPLTGLAAPSGAPLPSDPRGLSVLMTPGGKSLFHALEDGRVRVMWPGDAIAKAPEAVVITRTDLQALDARTLELPQEAAGRLAAGDAKLVIDFSTEGHAHSPTLSLRIHELLHRLGVRAKDCVYVTQDRGFRADYLAHRRALGGGDDAFEVLVHDCYIQALCAPMRLVGPDVFNRNLGLYASAGRARRKRFLSLNNKLVYPHRTLFLLRLLRDGLWDSGHVSVGRLYAFDRQSLSRGQFVKRVRSAPELREQIDEVWPLLDQLEARSPTYFGVGEDTPRGGATKSMVIPAMFDEYLESWFSVVAETEMDNRLRRITEKPFKPLLCFHPLIVFGSCGSLRLIREYGFRTFPDLFDESYDQETDLRVRFEMVYDQVVRLCRIGEAELARACEAATDALVFNAWWGLTRLPNLYRDRIDAALVDRLLGFVHGRQAALPT